MSIQNLKDFADQRGIKLKIQKAIVEEATENIAKKYNYSKDQIKENFDNLLFEIESEAYKVYLKYEKEYGENVLKTFIDHLVKTDKITNLNQVGEVLSRHFNIFDKFFLSLGQSRRTRAGSSFETIHNSLFKVLNYKFDEQKVINGKPDFLMPSLKHYKENPMDCIIFTSKRTLRERWRQVVTEGTRGLGFFLATIDTKVSSPQLSEMLNHRIYLVCPESIKSKYYSDKVNVLSFTQFFKDFLDPSLERWARNKII